MQHVTSFLNHGELPVAALAYSTKRELLLVCDGRYLRLYSARENYSCVKAKQLPPTVRSRPLTHVLRRRCRCLRLCVRTCRADARLAHPVAALQPGG